MPAKNPRLTITFEPSFMARLRRLSELTGNSQSALVSDLLKGCGPVLDRLITVLEAAEAAKAELPATLVRDMEVAQSRVEAQLGLALDDYDKVASGLVEHAEEIRRRSTSASTRKRAGGGAVACGSTPMSNRGVRNPSPVPRKVSP